MYGLELSTYQDNAMDLNLKVFVSPPVLDVSDETVDGVKFREVGKWTNEELAEIRKSAPTEVITVRGLKVVRFTDEIDVVDHAGRACVQRRLNHAQFCACHCFCGYDRRLSKQDRWSWCGGSTDLKGCVELAKTMVKFSPRQEGVVDY